MKRTNLICTINPSNSTVERIERLIWKGMTVARINLSHGDAENNLKLIANIRQAAANVTNRTRYFQPVAIALDLRGEEIRIAKIGENFNRKVTEGDATVKFSCDPKYELLEPLDLAYVPCGLITKFLKKGYKLLINHGKLELKITDIMGDNFFATVVKGSDEIKINQELFFPEIFKFLNLKPIPDKDLSDLKFAVDNDIDFILASHVQCGSTIREIKSQLNENVKVFAKIQNRYAVDEIGDIISASDGIIFAPSVEIETNVVPFMYRMILSMCKVNMKIMFIAFDTPLEHSVVCEVVNWLMSSGDGFMIAGEAQHLETVTRLSEISSSREELCNQTDEFCLHYQDQLVVLASCSVTSSLTTHAAAIFILSENDLLAYGVYFHAPKCVVIPIIMSSVRTARQLNILNGFIPLCLHTASLDKKVSDDEKVNFGIEFAKLRGLLKCGDTIVILTEKYSRIEYIQYETSA